MKCKSACYFQSSSTTASAELKSAPFSCDGNASGTPLQQLLTNLTAVWKDHSQGSQNKKNASSVTEKTANPSTKTSITGHSGEKVPFPSASQQIAQIVGVSSETVEQPSGTVNQSSDTAEQFLPAVAKSAGTIDQVSTALNQSLGTVEHSLRNLGQSSEVSKALNQYSGTVEQSSETVEQSSRTLRKSLEADKSFSVAVEPFSVADNPSSKTLAPSLRAEDRMSDTVEMSSGAVCQSSGAGEQSSNAVCQNPGVFNQSSLPDLALKNISKSSVAVSQSSGAVVQSVRTVEQLSGVGKHSAGGVIDPEKDEVPTVELSPIKLISQSVNQAMVSQAALLQLSAQSVTPSTVNCSVPSPVQPAIQSRTQLQQSAAQNLRTASFTKNYKSFISPNVRQSVGQHPKLLSHSPQMQKTPPGSQSDARPASILVSELVSKVTPLDKKALLNEPYIHMPHLDLAMSLPFASPIANTTGSISCPANVDMGIVANSDMSIVPTSKTGRETVASSGATEGSSSGKFRSVEPFSKMINRVVDSFMIDMGSKGW